MFVQETNKHLMACNSVDPFDTVGVVLHLKDGQGHIKLSVSAESS